MIIEKQGHKAWIVTEKGSSLMIPGRYIQGNKRVLAVRDVEPKDMTIHELLATLKDHNFSMHMIRKVKKGNCEPFTLETDKAFYIKESAKTIGPQYLLALLLTQREELHGKPVPHFESEGFYKAFIAGVEYKKKQKAVKLPGGDKVPEDNWPEDEVEDMPAPVEVSTDSDSDSSDEDSSSASGSGSDSSASGSDKDGSDKDDSSSASEPPRAPNPSPSPPAGRIPRHGQWGSFRITPKEKDGEIKAFQMTCWWPGHKCGAQKMCTKTFTTSAGINQCRRKLKLWALKGIEWPDKAGHQEAWEEIVGLSEADLEPEDVLDDLVARQDSSDS